MASHSISRLQLSTIPASNVSKRNHAFHSSSSVSFPLSAYGSDNSCLINFSFSLHCPKTKLVSPKVHAVATPISLSLESLPTANGKGVNGEKVKWSWRAIKSFAMGELEARKLKYASTGTEAILMGILIEGTSLAAKMLRAYGINLTKVKEESIKLLGKGDLYFFSPEHPPMTEEALRALDWALQERLKSGTGGEITTSDLLLGVWSEKESPGHKILVSLGFDDEKANNLKFLSAKPGFDEG